MLHILGIKTIYNFEKLNEDECDAFWNVWRYEEENKKISCLYLYWTCRYLSLFRLPRMEKHVSTRIEGNGPSLSARSKKMVVNYI